jgi:autotransporter-associated beta strand protein
LNNTNLGFTPNFAGTIIDSPDGPGSVLKSGGGTQILSGHNTYTGGTTISGGTLQLGIEDALSSTGPLTLSSGSTLNISSHTEHVGNVTLTSGTITGTTGATLVANSFTLSSGTVSAPVATSATITKTTTGTITDTMPISAGTLAVSQGIFDASGGVQANISVSSGAQLKARGTLTGNVGSSSGSTLMLTGSTIVNGNTAISGTLDVGSQNISFTTGHTTQVTTTNLSGGVITAPDGYQVGGNVSGYGTLLAPITNPNTGTQTITASGGTLSLGTFAASDSLSGYAGNLAAGSNALNLFSSSYTTLGSSATLAGGSINSFNGVRVKTGKSLSGFGIVTGPLDNQGTVTGGAAANTLHLTGAVTGPGSFQQNVTFEGSYSPGNSAASVFLSGNTVFAAPSRLNMELGGTTLGAAYDHITDTGLLTLGGTLNVSLISAFAPAAGQSFDLLDFDPAQTTGTFNAIELPALATGLSWNASRLHIDGTLSVNLQGDYNGNGTVDAADYVVYRNTLGQTGTALAADGNDNGVIDTGDLDIWRARFGQTAASGSISTATLPEPTTCILALVAAACCLRSRAKV